MLLGNNASSLKSLVSFTESLVEENEKLRKELITLQSAKNDEMTDLSNKYLMNRLQMVDIMNW